MAMVSQVAGVVAALISQCESLQPPPQPPTPATPNIALNIPLGVEDHD